LRISMKSDYALRAMMELASAYGSGPLQSSEIAVRRMIPESYLEQLLTVLRKAGLVASLRGPQGGHALAIHPSKVTAANVVRAMEGPLVVIDCLVAPDSCQLSEGCSLQELWAEVGAAVDATLERVTIEELATRQSTKDGRFMYNI
jgi:Rrf2 family protein